MRRVTATVLFTDLVGSTELRHRLGEDAAEALRRKHDQLLTQAVEADGGRVVKGLGDGIMATFTGASDAVTAAVAIQQAVGRLSCSGKTPMPLAVRVGLSAGDVTFEDDDVHGTPVIEASRLCAAAGGGEIFVSEVVRLLGGPRDFDFGPRGSLELKGLPDPVVTWAVRWEPAPASRIPMPALLTDVGRIFVGRDGELERLGQLWKQAAVGERRVALLAGEPGVGKTRLAAELAIRVGEEGGVVLAGRCDEDLGVPYQPFVEALRHFVDHTEPRDLEDRLGRYGGELARLLPELCERLPGFPPPLQSDPETERYRLFDAVAAWLSAASAEEPLLVVLDDLQWAAKPTLLLLRHVVRASNAARLMIVGTYRDSELTHDHPLIELVADLRRANAVERSPLSGLDDVAVAAIVEQAVGQVLDENGAALARAIYQETEGNPFFVREVLRHLAETNAVERHDGGWRTPVPIDQLGIPEGVRDVVGRRLSRLSEEANQALRVAAVVGPEFEVDLVQAAGEFPQGQLLAALDESVGARLLGEVSPTRFRFSHALVRTTLYESLTGPRKASLHRCVAEAIEALHDGALDDHLPALAHHWCKGSALAADTARATEYARRAGDRASSQLAHDEAVTYYRQALELLGVGADDGSRRLELLIVMGDAQRRAGDPGYRETLVQATRLAQKLGDADGCARAALANGRGPYSRWEPVDLERVAILEQALEAIGPAETLVRARLLASLASELYFANDDRRYAVGDEALGIARRLGDQAVLAEVVAAAWYATWDPTGLERRAALVDELAQLARSLGDHLLEFHAGLAQFLTAMEQAKPVRADAALDLCGRIAEELGQPLLRWQLLYTQASRAMAAGRLDDAERLVEEARRWGEALGQPVAVLYHRAGLALIRALRTEFEELIALLEPFRTFLPFQAVLAWSYAEIGRVSEAHALVDGLRGGRFAAVPRDHVWLPLLAFLARASIRLEDTEATADLYALLHPHRGETLVVPAGWVGPVAHDLGCLAASLGRYDDAEEHFASAAETLEAMRSPVSLTQTHLEWARMLLARGKPADRGRARELLGQSLATARELGLGPVERRAAALLEFQRGAEA